MRRVVASSAVVAGMKRGSRWLAQRGGGDVTGVATAVGGGFGALGGFLDVGGLTVESLTTVGSVFGGLIGLLAWIACRAKTPLLFKDEVPRRADLLERLRTDALAQIQSQWRVILDGRPRLTTRFRPYENVAPPRGVHGSVRQRTNLVAALDAATIMRGGPRLLVVGETGTGKTVALLDLAHHLAHHHLNRFGVPVVLSLGSWRYDDNDLSRWVVRRLCMPGGPLPGCDDAVASWLAEGRIALVLDGLDEIPDSEARERCIDALNSFIDRLPTRTAFIVSSRTEEYAIVAQHRAGRLAVNAAIELEFLHTREAAARLRDPATKAGDHLADVIEASGAKPVVRLLRVPLWLWLAGSLDNAEAHDLVKADDAGSAETILADAYLRRALRRVADGTQLTPLHCRRLLAAIAGFLEDPRTPDSTTFRYEDLTLSRPGRTRSRQWRIALTALHFAAVFLVVSQAANVGAALVCGIMVSVLVGVPRQPEYPTRPGPRLDGRPQRLVVRPPTVHDVAAVLTRAFRSAFVVGPLIAMVADVRAGVAGGLAFGTAYAFVDRFVTTSVAIGYSLDGGRRASWASMTFNIVVIGLLFGFVGWLIGGPAIGLILGSTFGLVSGADNGGCYLAVQCLLRHRATRTGLLPPDLKAFIASAVDARLLRSVTGGVQFRHKVLADRLAIEAPIPGLADLRIRTGGDSPSEMTGGSGRRPRRGQSHKQQRHIGLIR